MTLFKYSEKLLPLLKCIENLSERSKKVIIAESKRDLILSIVEICKNIINDAFNVSSSEKFQLKKYSRRILKLVKRERLTKNLREEKKLINYRGNIGFLSIIIKIALENAGELCQEVSVSGNKSDKEELESFEDQIKHRLSDDLCENTYILCKSNKKIKLKTKNCIE